MIGALLALVVGLGIYIPAPPTSASVTVVTQAPDWASDAVSDYPAVDMLGGDVSTDNWVQANTIGASNAIDSVTVDAARGAVSLAITTGGAEDAGWLTAAVAGDFCYAMRLGYETATISTSTMNTQMFAAFVDDGAESVDADEWFGLGWYRAGVAATTGNNVQSCRGGSAGDQWAGCSATLVRESEATAWDVLFKRSGTTLTLYMATPRSNVWNYVATYTVTANAGRIGVRIKTNLAYTITVYLSAFRRFATCPR